MSKWKSSVLTCFDDDDHCAICRFIAGKPCDLIDVIELLDGKLHDAEEMRKRLVDVLLQEQELKKQHAAEVDRLKMALVLVRNKIRNGRQPAEILAFIDSVIGEETDKQEFA